MKNHSFLSHRSTSDLIIIFGSIIVVIFSVLILITKSLIKNKNSAPKDDLNTFENIDTTIKTSKGQYSYENTTNNFQTYFKSDPMVDNAIKFSNNSASLTFYTSPIQSFATADSREKPSVSDSSITYPKVFPNIDLKYSINPTRLLEEFIVTDKNTALNIDRITQKVVTTGVDKHHEIDGKIDFYHQGKKTYTVPKPVMYELNSPHTTSFGIKYEVNQISENQYTIDKIITEEGKKWLNDHNRSYPIVIDLVIDNADAVVNWTSNDTTNAAATQDTVVKQEGTGSVKINIIGYAGTGKDGACTVSSTSNDEINTESCVGRATADAVNFSSIVNTAAGATGIVVSTTTTGLDAGDEVLIINLQGVATTYADVGKYEFRTITSKIGNTALTFDAGLDNTYNGTTQKIMVQRVPQYTTVTVNSGQNFRPMAFNGTKGGVIAFKANGTVTVSSSGTIHANGLGYAGGTGGVDGGAAATGGQAFCGTYGGGSGGLFNGVGSTGVCGGGGGGGYNMTTPYAGAAGSASLGGGGGAGGTVHYLTNPLGGGGAGGGYGTFGYYGIGTSNGTSGGTNTSGGGAGGGLTGGGGGGGGTYGDATLGIAYLGAGGGGGGGGGTAGGIGGTGGGIIIIHAETISIGGTLSSIGTSGAAPTYGGGGGGGAGGSIRLLANSITLGTNLVSAPGGVGGNSTSGGDGGTGGAGRIAAYYITSLSGSTNNPTATTGQSNLKAYQDTVTKTTSIDLSSSTTITFYVRSNVAGQNLQFRFGEAAASENAYNITIGSTNTWEQKSWDITGIGPTARDAVTLFQFYINDSRASQIFNFDNIQTTVNNLPATPSLSLPANGAIGQINTPTFKTVTTDTELDNLQYELKICTNSGMTVGCVTYDQTASNVGWSGQNVGTSAYSSGTTAVYVMQPGTTLAPGTTYYWKTRAKDYAGSKNWSYTQVTPYSFTTQAIPNTPTLISPVNGSLNQPRILSLGTSSTDQESDFLQYRITICTDSGMTTGCNTYSQQSSNVGWSGQNVGTSAYSSGSIATYTLQSVLSPGLTYYWKSQAVDPNGSGGWSDTQATPFSFTVTGTPEITRGCLLQKANNNSSIIVKWSNKVTYEDGISLEKNTDSAGFVALINLAAGTTAYTDNAISSGHTYQYRIAPYFTGPLYGDWCETPTLNVQTGTFHFY